jgi:enamine deaminase RidA (YjgF/YER057c/UK114 family)
MVTDLILKRNGYKHIWSAGISVQEALPASDQTKHVFSSYNRCLEELNLKLKNNVLRTWLYVQNIDTNYSDVVKARKDFFNVNGLTRDTHYITSTGIEGKYTDPNVKVFMDAYAVDGITEEQIRFLKAPAFLNPTHEYGVTFERGVSVEYGDRKHIFIAGTASINNKGEILYENEILLQLGRTKENIIALLDEAGAGLQDIAHLIAYVRDIADYPVVKNYIEENFGPVPKIIVLAAICRPGWLTEIECIAIKNAENLILNNF